MKPNNRVIYEMHIRAQLPNEQVQGHPCLFTRAILPTGVKTTRIRQARKVRNGNAHNIMPENLASVNHMGCKMRFTKPLNDSEDHLPLDHMSNGRTAPEVGDIRATSFACKIRIKHIHHLILKATNYFQGANYHLNT